MTYEQRVARAYLVYAMYTYIRHYLKAKRITVSVFAEDVTFLHRSTIYDIFNAFDDPTLVVLEDAAKRNDQDLFYRLLGEYPLTYKIEWGTIAALTTGMELEYSRVEQLRRYYRVLRPSRRTTSQQRVAIPSGRGDVAQVPTEQLN